MPSQSSATIPTLEGRRFVLSRAGAGGEADCRTVFEYHQDGDAVWARYAGGPVRLGFLVGVRDEDTLLFRYSQLSADGATSSGRCETVMTVASDGTVVLDERWSWESRPGSGTSVLVEAGSAHGL